MQSGIYIINNILDNKIYIGSASNFKLRWNRHKSYLSRNKHYNRHLQAAYNKYGSNNFKYEILLYCSKQDLLMYEQKALGVYKPEYNICKIAGSRSGILHSKETKQKISMSCKGIKNSLGYKQSEEHKNKIRLALMKEKI